MTRDPRSNRKLHGWSQRDASIGCLWFVLLLLGALKPVLIGVAFALAVVFVASLGVRHLLHRRRWRRDPPPEFWADRIKE